MTQRELKAVNAIAGFCWGACVAVAIVAGYALIQSQDAIDEVVAQQQAIACFEHSRMCAAVEAAKK